jgi:hypothetical protein
MIRYGDAVPNPEINMESHLPIKSRMREFIHTVKAWLLR